MALTLNKDVPKPEEPNATAPDDSMVLCLASYSRFVRDGVLYEKGQGYKFTRAQAEILLSDTDEIRGTPIWKTYVPMKKRMLVEREVPPEDMRHQDLSVEEVRMDDSKPGKEIHIGNDDDDPELAAHLAAAAGGEDGAVQV